MSINDLIHTNARHAYEQGVKTERERIIKELTKYHKKMYHYGERCKLIAQAIELIKDN